MDNVMGNGFSALGTSVRRTLDGAGEARDRAVQGVVDRTPFGQAGHVLDGDKYVPGGGNRGSGLGLR